MLVLASQSPRRKELLERAGIRLTVRAASVPEDPVPGELPQGYVRRLAEAKAAAVERRPGEVVLGADTTVVIAGQILGKPESDEDARRMLRLLSGRVHEVLTGICLLADRAVAVDHSVTAVRFSDLSEREIDHYVASREPHDKAGAYAIQGLASKFIERIDGDYSNVVGLPVALVYRHLKELAPQVLQT